MTNNYQSDAIGRTPEKTKSYDHICDVAQGPEGQKTTSTDGFAKTFATAYSYSTALACAIVRYDDKLQEHSPFGARSVTTINFRLTFKVHDDYKLRHRTHASEDLLR